jgi:hypothetical protein
MLVSLAADAQGLKYDGPKQGRQRFTVTEDAKVGGPAFRDTATGLVWMRCAVGQEFDADKAKCLGQFDPLTYQQATEFADRIGGGWRLPTFRELETITNDLPAGLYNDYSTRSILTSGRGASNPFGGGFDACRAGMGFWSASGVDGDPNRVYALRCSYRTMHQPMEFETAAKASSRRYAVILVRK